MNFGDFHFAGPRWLWLALLAPIFLGWLHWHASRKRREQLAKMASAHFLESLSASHSPARRRLKEFLLILVFIFAGLALARPQWGRIEGGNTFVGEDVVFVLDCSQSMTATDVLPSRMQRAKFAMLDFVQRQSHGRVGLVAFAGSAFLQCPLTFDVGAFEETLASVDEKTIPIPGTDIGRALGEAARAMDKNARRKMVVLVTDGEDLEKSGIAESRHLATNGVVVFTIGVGTPAGKEIQVRNAAGQPELLRDSKGEIVRSRLDEKTLRDIAQATGGSYFPLGRLGEGLTQIKTAMHQLDTAAALQASAKRGVDRYYVPLTVLFLLVTIEPLIGTRRRRLPTALVLVCLWSGFHSTSLAGETNLPPPVTARDFYNAGTRLLANKKFPEAQQMFQASLAKQDEAVQPLALFNLAHARFDDGLETLKKGPDAQRVSAQAETALANGDSAIRSAQSALAGSELDSMIGAYLRGRGARRELKAAEKAVQAAMETYGKTLQKWQRSADDFRGAAELNPRDTNAVHNAETVEKAIAKLVDSLRRMQQMANMMGNQRQELSKLLSKLKGQIPAANAPPGTEGEDDDEGENGQGEVKPESLSGKEENAGRTGEATPAQLSPDQAGQILDGLPIDSGKRLPMGGDKEGTPAKDKTGRNW